MSDQSKSFESASAPCDLCPMSSECAVLMKCCSSMSTFIESGVSRDPTKPTTELFDKVYGAGYKYSGYHVLNRSQFLETIDADPKLKTPMCDRIFSSLYTSASGHDMPNMEGLYADWDWLIAVSKNKIAPIVMGALGYERHGDSIYVSYLYTRDYYKGMGVGSKLLGIIEMHAKDRVILLPEDDTSHQWYTNRGYSSCEEMDMAWEKITNET